MTISAEKSWNGSKDVRTVGENEILYVAGDPGVTFTKGDTVSISNGVLILSTDSLATSVGVVAKTTVCPANTQAFPIGPNPPSDLDGAAAKCLIPIIPHVAAGTKVRQSLVYGYTDETVVTAANAAVTYIGCTTGFDADDYPNGAIAYIYEGPGKGEINIVEDYDHTGGTPELKLIFHRAWNATLTTATKFIVLTPAAAAQGVGQFGRMDIYDEDQLDVTDGYDDGDFVIYEDFLKLGQYLKNIAVPYITARSIGW